MTEDKKQSEEITPAGAVELEETALDETSGGGLSADTIAWKLDPAGNKYDPVGNKYDPVGFKFNPVGVKF